MAEMAPAFSWAQVSLRTSDGVRSYLSSLKGISSGRVSMSLFATS